VSGPGEITADEIDRRSQNALDHGSPGIEWLEELMLAAAVTVVLALLVAGIVFAGVLYVGAGPPDPSEGRGAMKRQWKP
jgi:hypothetical protein